MHKIYIKYHPKLILIIGNGRLRHPDGDFRDWTQHLWDINIKNTNYFMMKNGRIEVLKRGLYFVYAQVRLYF